MSHQMDPDARNEPRLLHTVETHFAWRDLRFHVVTRQPPTDAQLKSMRQVIGHLDRVGSFAATLGVMYSRRVRIRTTRPEADIWFEVGL